ncbi:MAG: alcohol dehydrogenase catalytic domain-containing protein [Nitrospirota bacterium]|nr:alcohol dehydrogenase catalytic domain-containing protein [Nitrospirota bacterium]
MKAIVVEEIGSFSITEMDIPVPGEAEVLIRVSVTGLCRTDLKIIRAGHRDLVLPRVPGEEVVGVITRTGPAVKRFEVGQRVYVYPGTSCGSCQQCGSGAENLCEGMKIMGFHRDGGFAEYVLAPEASVIPVPENVTDEEAVFSEPLSCCLNALELAGLSPGERIGIWGAGPAGTLLSRASAGLGAIPYSMEPDERRRALIRGFASPPVKGFDVVVVAVGSADAYREALGHLRPRGRVVIFSGLPRAAAELPVDFNRLHYYEQTLVGAYGCSFRHGGQALQMLSEGSIAVRDMISHRMSLWELGKALCLVEERAGMKILLYP